MPTKSPLEEVNDKFGGKDKLVEKLVGLLESDEPKEELRKRLLAVANKKLLRLHGVASLVKEKYGSREKLLEQLVGSTGRAKDKDYRTRLDSFTTPRLVDAAKVAERRSKAAVGTKGRATAAKTAKPAAAKKEKEKAAKKPAAKSSAKSGKSSTKTAG
jgi:hypothetical protein